MRATVLLMAMVLLTLLYASTARAESFTVTYDLRKRAKAANESRLGERGTLH